jgi:hypothetical protein
MSNRFGHPIVRQDAINIIIQIRRKRGHFDDHVKADPLRGATLCLKGADLDLYDVIAQRNPVQRRTGRCRFRPLGRVRKGKMDF